MPAPNDLTPEEEAMFGAHGVEPAGQGREPVDDGQGQQQQQADDDGQQQQQADDSQQQQQADEPPINNRHPDGKFKSKEEMDAEREALGQSSAEPKMVPLAALQEERRRIAHISQRAQLAETRMNAMIARGLGGPQAEGQPQKPNLAEDPAAYILDLERRLEEFAQGRQQEEEFRQIDTALTSDEDLFKLSVPDYDAASDHFVQSRARELLQFYTPQEAQRMMTDEARNIAKQAWQRGQSAGEMIYRLAMARGYVPGQAQQQDDGQQRQQQGQRGPSAQDAVRAIRNGKAQSRSLGGGGGGGGAQALNAQALLEMGDDEFEAYLALGKKGANERFAAIG